MLKKTFLVTLCCALPLSADGQSFESMKSATELGSILASEQFCGLAYDQDMIAAWIDENTDASDMGFAANLQMMTEGSRFGLEGLSQSSKTAHCRSIERTARHFGFIE